MNIYMSLSCDDVIIVKQQNGDSKFGTITYVWDKENLYNLQYLDGNTEFKKPLNLLCEENNEKIYSTSIIKKTETKISVKKESLPVKKENFCYQCSSSFKNARDLELHQWSNHPSDEYQRAWANNDNKRGFYADDPYY